MDRLIANVRVIRKYELSGSELRRLRAAAGLSEEQLAAVLLVSRKQVQRLQKRKVIEMSHAEITNLLDAVGATLL